MIKKSDEASDFFIIFVRGNVLHQGDEGQIHKSNSAFPYFLRKEMTPIRKPEIIPNRWAVTLIFG
mgnify:CR=1 FL=1